MKYKHMKYTLVLAVIASVFFLQMFFFHAPVNYILSRSDEKETLSSALETICNARAQALRTGDIKPLSNYYDTSQKNGRGSLQHEVKRVKYLKDWAKKRNITFDKIDVKIYMTRTLPSRLRTADSEQNAAKLYFYEVYRFDYHYTGDDYPTANSFGVRLSHVTDLREIQNRWMVYNDWYLDCFEDAISAYTGEFSESDLATAYIVPTQENTSDPKRGYNRQSAVNYADKYCAIPWANGGNTKYNKAYKNYNGIGGDCTNYISQCLGDKEGGELPMDGAWFSNGNKFGNGSGSTAWVNAGKFKDYILYSGKGSLIAKGTYKTLTAANDKNSSGAIGQLSIGDIISYEKKGKIDHSAIITGFDSSGYPLVNTHTVDRYHVPWDLGWSDNGINFFLIHIN